MKTILGYYLPMTLFFMMINLGVGFVGYYGMDAIKEQGSLVATLVAVGVIAALSIGAVVFSIIKKHRPASNSLWLALTLSINAYLFTETCTGSYFLKDSVVYSVLAPLFIFTFYFIGAAAFKKPKIFFTVLTVIFEFFGVLQYFVFAFRGAPIRASDINNVASAMEISSDYSASAGYGPMIIVLAVLNLAAACCVIWITKLSPLKIKTRIICGAVSLLTGVLICVFSTRIFDYGVENRIIKFNFSGNEDFTSYKDTVNVFLSFLDVVNSGDPAPV